jgi:hypothetical protein
MTEIQRRAFLARCFVFEHVSPLEDIPMPSHHDAWLRHQQSRWLRQDAARWVRPDAARFLPPGADIAKAFPALARKYDPDQPRVLAGKRRWGRQSRPLSDQAARQHDRRRATRWRSGQGMMMIATSLSRHGRNILVFRDHRLMIRQTSLFKLTHYQITGWYRTPNEYFGHQSPREDLSDKTWAERRELGLYALRKFKALKQ